MEETKEKEGAELYEERPPELEPTEFQEGFTFKTALGALFVGLIMMPGSIYLGLVVGQELGSAAEWTTIILFTEVARRSFTTLRRQELYLIFYMAGALASGAGVAALSGGPFAWLIWNQYLVQSPPAEKFGIAKEIPRWVVPQPDSPAIIHRTFLHADWKIPILLLLVGQVMSRLQWMGLGYLLFRTTSDIERLPFPMAPIAAQGATALAEVSQEQESWRWPVFSTGAMVGLVYGALYVFLPVITGAFLTAPLMIIPIPFVDLTQNAEGAFPTGMIAIGTELGSVLSGFVVPFPIVVGSFITSMFTNFIFSPTLFRMHPELFGNWKPGMSVIQTQIATSLDLWMSVGIGINLAIAVIGIGVVIRAVMKARRNRERRLGSIPTGRGDFPVWTAAVAWAISAVAGILICHALVPRFPLWILIIFGLLWSPINSYISARLIGITGRGIGIPMLREATFILSGYKGVDIWFAPMPLYDQGMAAQRWREIELTGTRFMSVVKAEIFLMVFLVACSFLFWSFFWKLGPIPSASYPYAQTYWPLNATWSSLWATATREQSPWLLKAIKPEVVGGAFGGTFLLYGVLAAFSVPVMWFYGLISGIGASTTGAIPWCAGALLGRYYMRRRFGMKRWQMYAPVLFAGYACGTGLMGMAGISLAIIFKAVRVLPF